MAHGLHEYRSAIGSFAALIAGALIFFWISRGTQYHQLAIGTLLSAVTLAAALSLFEICWRIGLRVMNAEDRTK